MSRFERVSHAPLLGLEAVPWAAPMPVVTGQGAHRREVRRTIMHPSVVELGKRRPGAPRFILYYAPHHSDGVGAATAERIEGPWTPLRANPILTLDAFSGIRGHVSGPDAVYVPEEDRFRLYVHGAVPGAGQQTEVAASDDGIRFRAVSRGPIVARMYLRVFRHGGRWYGIARFGNALGLVRSEDGLAWEESPRGPLLETGDAVGEYDRIRHHAVWIACDTLYFYYCTYLAPDLSVEAIKLATMRLAGDWDQWGAPRREGVILAQALEWEAGNLRDPYILEADGRLHMFYVGGNEAGIGLAREVG